MRPADPTGGSRQGVQSCMATDGRPGNPAMEGGGFQSGGSVAESCEQQGWVQRETGR